MSRRTFIASVGVAAFSPACSAMRHVSPSGEFTVGVWQQPVETISQHIADGINTFVSMPRDVDREEWLTAASSAGLQVIVEPSRLDKEAIDRDREFNIEAYLLPDEPDLNTATRQKSLRSAAILSDAAPEMPIMANFSGGVLTRRQTDDAGGQPDDDLYRNLAAHASVLSQDFYPVAGWNKPEWIDLSVVASSATAEALTRLQAIKRSAKRFAVIETGPQNLPWLNGQQPSPTPEQVRGQVWDAILNGAKGIVYFTVAIEPFSWDSRSVECRAEIVKINSAIRRYSSAICSQQGPISRVGTLQRSEFSDGESRSVTVSVNLSSQPESIDGERFEPYEVRFDEIGY